MGSIIRRGSRDEPKYHVKYRDSDGRWKMRLSHQPTKEQAKRYLREVEARVARGLVGIPEIDDAPLAGELVEAWMAGLTNRNAADDRGRIKRHVVPAFGKRQLADITLGVIMAWIDEQRQRLDADGERELSEGSIRHNLNMLSRFFAWAIERGHATVNPVRQIPTGRRPQQAQKRDVPWLKDGAPVRKLMKALPEPIDKMFYLGNRSGLRTGELAALRMADLDFLGEGVIRVRFSYDGPLKEDKHGTGKVKWAPAPHDIDAVLGPWLAARRAAGAGPEDLVFPCPGRDGSWYRKELIEARWDKATEAVGIDLTWYEATRHSFTSRNLEAGASLDEVSSALGHSSPVVTRRYYDHYIRRTFSSTLRTGLGVDPSEAKATNDAVTPPAKTKR